MVKAPRVGEVKTRLTSLLSPQDAADLAACFAQDAIAKALRITSNVIVAYAPATGRTMLEMILPKGLIWIEQRGADLGQRMTNVFLEAESQGFSPLVMIGTDSPTMPDSFIETAIDSLSKDESDLALGPTDDGGYCLIAARSFHRELLRDVEWSTPRAFEQTAANARRLGLRLIELPRWHDVDEAKDLQRLKEELNNNEDARANAPSTNYWIQNHFSDARTGA